MRGGGVLYLQNLPLKQVGYDLHVDTLFIAHGLSFLYWTVALSITISQDHKARLSQANKPKSASILNSPETDKIGTANPWQEVNVNPVGVRSGVPERVSISCPTCGSLVSCSCILIPKTYSSILFSSAIPCDSRAFKNSNVNFMGEGSMFQYFFFRFWHWSVLGWH